jgi:hypothetical protein
MRGVFLAIIFFVLFMFIGCLDQKRTLGATVITHSQPGKEIRVPGQSSPRGCTGHDVRSQRIHGG